MDRRNSPCPVRSGHWSLELLRLGRVESPVRWFFHTDAITSDSHIDFGSESQARLVVQFANDFTDDSDKLLACIQQAGAEVRSVVAPCFGFLLFIHSTMIAIMVMRYSAHRNLRGAARLSFCDFPAVIPLPWVLSWCFGVS